MSGDAVRRAMDLAETEFGQGTRHFQRLAGDSGHRRGREQVTVVVNHGGAGQCEHLQSPVDQSFPLDSRALELRLDIDHHAATVAVAA